MLKKIKSKKNYKLIIGLIIGFIFSSSIAYASYMGRANQLSYDPSNNWLKSTNVQDALDELYKQKGCPLGYVCYQKKSTLALGDYISYTPSKTSYTTDTSKTGYTSTQTINPSELNLWRVISINGNGTVDIISEHVSSTAVSFRGQTGYRRHFGYNGQTEYITDTTYFVNPAPWTCSTGGACTPDPDDYEAYGGGDKLYQSDYDLINTVLGTRVANNPSGTATSYWMASRYYLYASSTYYYWDGRYVNPSGSGSYDSLYYYYSSSFNTMGYGYALRPIVTLKSGLSYYGLGNEYYPMVIQ